MAISRRRPYGLLLLLVLPLALGGCGKSSQSEESAPSQAISGHIDAGLRVLTLDPAATGQHVTIYRGDYVRPELSTGESFTLDIPALEVSRSFPAPADEHPYFKVPNAGSFTFRLGAAGGVIEAIEYTSPRYREVGAQEAAQMIANVDPLILDVRTEREFAGGHIDGAVLIPVQDLQRRLGELSIHKQDPVFVYCATGNRSTVAAKLLVDAGFVQVENLRHGIAEWNREKLPTVK
jgi:rhodanese-related sulfurtransferase